LPSPRSPSLPGPSGEAEPDSPFLPLVPCSVEALPDFAAWRVSRSCETRCCSVRSCASKEPSESFSCLSMAARRSSEVWPGPLTAAPVPAPAPGALWLAALPLPPPLLALAVLGVGLLARH
jgi:hypothetical protein